MGDSLKTAEILADASEHAEMMFKLLVYFCFDGLWDRKDKKSFFQGSE